MNDHDAIDAINEQLEKWFSGEITEIRCLARISSISGQNIYYRTQAAK